LPSNLDQYLNMGLVSRSGAGILVRQSKSLASDVRRAAEEIFAQRTFTTRALATQVLIRQWNPAQKLAEILQAASATREPRPQLTTRQSVSTV